MMKRMVCTLALLLVLVLSVSALAEEFTLHSGVKFGMTIEEVMQAEKDAGFEPTEGTIDTQNCSEIHQKNGVHIEEQQVAGVDDAYIQYHFDNEGKLDSAIYNLRRGYFESSDIKDSMIEKYGKYYEQATSDRIHELRAELNLDVYNRRD